MTSEIQQEQLKLFIENDGDLYRQRTVPIWKNLQKKKLKKTYNPQLAIKLFRILVNEGAKKYIKLNWDERYSPFSPSDKLAVAKEFEKEFSEEYALGNIIE